MRIDDRFVILLMFLLVIGLQLALPSPLPGLADTGGIQFVSSVYGPRSSPMGGSSNGSFHSGLDIACRVGTPVLALSAGTVMVCAYGDRVFGRYVVVRDDNGIDVLYGHLSATFVPRGTSVRAGQRIGLSGNSGQSTGPHLHLQVMMSTEAYSNLFVETYVSTEPSHWRYCK